MNSAFRSVIEQTSLWRLCEILLGSSLFLLGGMLIFGKASSVLDPPLTLIAFAFFGCCWLLAGYGLWRKFVTRREQREAWKGSPLLPSFIMSELGMDGEPDAELDDELNAHFVASWKWLIGPNRQPFMFTVLGDALLEDETGAVDWLDTLQGTLTRVADSAQAFRELWWHPLWDRHELQPRFDATRAADDRWWSDLGLFVRCFRPTLVLALRDSGRLPGVAECYSPIVLPLPELQHARASGWHLLPAQAHFETTARFHAQRRSQAASGSRTNPGAGVP